MKTKMTSKEQAAVTAFIAAAKALPRSLAIELDTFGEAPHLTVLKRTGEGEAREVARLTKSSLYFG